MGVSHFWISVALFGVRKGLEMILSNIALPCLNMSSYRAIWTHFGQKIMLLPRCPLSENPRCFLKLPLFVSCHSHIFCWYVQKPRSQKVSIEETALSQSHLCFLACHVPRRSKTLSERGCITVYGSHLFANKVGGWSSVLKLPVFWGQTQKHYIYPFTMNTWWTLEGPKEINFVWARPPNN